MTGEFQMGCGGSDSTRTCRPRGRSPSREPAVANVGLWGAEDPELADDEGSHLAYAAVARKP